MKAKRWQRILLAISLISALTISAAAVTPVGTNLVANGGFENAEGATPPTSFLSEYTWLNPASTGAWTLGPEYMFTVGTNPGNYHSGWQPGFAAHGGSQMLIVNGTTDGTLPNKIVWGQNITGLTCVPVPTVTTTTLWAGQNYDAGDVQLKVEGGKLWIRFVITGELKGHDGWLITGIHAHAALDCTGIPQKNGNPIPGKFALNLPFTPGTLDTGWREIPYSGSLTGPICVAAHANIEHPQVTEVVPFDVYSGTDAMVGSSPATLAWVHPLWNPNLTINLSPAQWIWNAYRSPEPVNGNIVEFTHGFPLTGTPLSGTLYITADNGFEARLNGTLLGDSTNLTPGWRLSDLTEAWVNTGAGIPSWATVRTFDVGSLLGASNTLAVTGVNEQMDGGDVDNNPAGVIYKLSGTQRIVVEGYDSETGWGDGHDFPGANWATCIEFTPGSTCDYGSYLLEFYAANSWVGNATYPANPAQLEVSINGVVVGATLNVPAAVGQWAKYSAVWNAGTANQANIEIRDLRLEFWGDDFCIDDISFVKLP